MKYKYKWEILFIIMCFTSIALGSFMGLKDGSGGLLLPDRTKAMWQGSQQEEPTPIEGPNMVYDPNAPYGIGIPTPLWGDLNPLDVNYTMYVYEANQNPALTYRTDSPDSEVYTHYVDWEDENATDEDNPFGTVAIPRKRPPVRVPAGSIVEIHDTGGSGYTRDAPYGSIGYSYFSSDANETWPTFYRGINDPNFFNQTLCFSGDYIIVENFLFYNEAIVFTYEYNYTWGWDWVDHICMRDCEVTGSTDNAGRAVTITDNASYCVVYNNHIHHNGQVEYEGGYDMHGIGVTGKSSYCWIYGNEINNNDGDSVQIMGSYPASCPNNIYVSHNTMYADRENAVDMKYSNDCVISQNDIYGYTNEARLLGSDPNEEVPFGGGSAILTSNEYTLRVWFLFNCIHDSISGASIEDDKKDDPNVYLIGNVFHSLNGMVARGWDEQLTVWIGNIAYDVNGGMWTYDGDGDDLRIEKYHNNIVSKVLGGYSDSNRLYYDYYIALWDEDGALLSEMRNNVFYDGGGWQYGDRSTVYETVSALETAWGDYCSGNVEADPLFTNPNNNDFTLQVGSPVFDMEFDTDVSEAGSTYYSAFGIDINDYIMQYFEDGTVYAPTGGL